MGEITIRAWREGALSATRVDEAAAEYQLVQADGYGRYRGLKIRGAVFSEVELDLTGKGGRRRGAWSMSSVGGDGGLRTEWVTSFLGGVVSGSVLSNGSWTSKTDDSDGNTTRTVRSDGQGEVVEETRDRSGNLVGRAITNSRKGAEDREEYDGKNQKTSERERRWSSSTGEIADLTYTEDERNNQFAPDGHITKTTTSHTETRVDRGTGKISKVTTFETDDDLGGHTTGTTTGDGVHSSTTSHTDYQDGSSSDFTGSTSPGHREGHTVFKDNQGNVTGTTDESEHTWTDSNGKHRDTHSDTTVDGKSSHEDTHSVQHQDGSSEKTWESSDGTSYERGSTATDSGGNTSTTTSEHNNETDETTTTTTTTDKDGNGTEHTTVTDKDGNEVSDETHDVHPSSNGSTPDPEGGTDEGPKKPTHQVGKALDELDWRDRTSAAGDGGEADQEQSPLLTIDLARKLMDFVVSVASSGNWGDSSSGEGPQTSPHVDIDIGEPPSAVDDWGDIRNPHALVGTVDRLFAYAQQSGHESALRGAALMERSILERLG